MDILSGSNVLDSQYQPTRDAKGAIVPRVVRELFIASPTTPAAAEEFLEKEYHRTDADKATEIVRFFCGAKQEHEHLPPSMKGAVPMPLADRSTLAKAIKAGNFYPRLLCEDSAPAASTAPAPDLSAQIADGIAKALPGAVAAHLKANPHLLVPVAIDSTPLAPIGAVALAPAV